ncbi:MAG: cation:proton antiporter [Burkholderiales bacterium]
MDYAGWLVAVGAMLVAIYATSHVVARMPASPALVYLVIGMAIGPLGFGWVDPDPARHAALIEHAAELAILVSLFATGSVVGTTLRVEHWRVPVRLASFAMVATIALLAAFAYFVLGLSPGASLVLAGALAPTDPVLAGDVQVDDERDRDRLRFGLTGEAGLNDGAAFPFVAAGLALLGLESGGSEGVVAWVARSAWSVIAAIAIGASLGLAAATWVGKRLREGIESEASESFLGLGLVAVSYGLALFVDAYGFLAVFGAAVTLQWSLAGEGARGAGAGRESATKETAMAPIHQFNADLESLFEFALVIACGVLVTVVPIPLATIALSLALFLIIRPASVMLAMIGTPLGAEQRALASWFGIRGVGSLYYVFYALTHGWRGQEADYVLGLVLGVIAASVVVHGVSVTPLMHAYERHRSLGGRRRA